MLLKLMSLSTLIFFLILFLRGRHFLPLLSSTLCLLFVFLEGYQGREELSGFRFWYSTGEFTSYGHVITFAQNLARLLFFFTLLCLNAL